MKIDFKNRVEGIRCQGIFCLQQLEMILLLFWITWLVRPAYSSTTIEDTPYGGPFPVRNYNPVQLLFLSLPPEMATTLSKGSSKVTLDLAESSVILTESTQHVDAVMKFETFRYALNLKHGLTDRLEVGVEIPFYYRDGGFLDPFIKSVENSFDARSTERLSFKDGSFGGFKIIRDGKSLVSGGDQERGLGDISLNAKYLALSERENRPAIALRLAAKLPTGDFNRAFGSGKADFGVGLAAQKTLGSRWVLYLNQSVVFPMNHFGDTDLTLKPIYTMAITGEYLWTKRFSLVGQLNAYSTPFQGTGIGMLDHGVTEAVFGFNYRIRPQIPWKVYIIENFNDPEPGAAADFTLATTIGIQF
ncbi:MAG: DUF3187 family protein [Nitrospirae bacterium]|nr:DUF3187 family protein [Nitrospirota bacterium]